MAKVTEQIDGILNFYSSYIHLSAVISEWSDYISKTLDDIEDIHSDHHYVDQDLLQIWVEHPDHISKSTASTGDTFIFHDYFSKKVDSQESAIIANLRKLIQSRRTISERNDTFELLRSNVNLFIDDFNGFIASDDPNTSRFRDCYNSLKNGLSDIYRNIDTFHTNLFNRSQARDIKLGSGILEWKTNPHIFFAIISALKEKGFIEEIEHGTEQALDDALYDIFLVSKSDKLSDRYTLGTFKAFCKKKRDASFNRRTKPGKLKNGLMDLFDDFLKPDEKK